VVGKVEILWPVPLLHLSRLDKRVYYLKGGREGGREGGRGEVSGGFRKSCSQCPSSIFRGSINASITWREGGRERGV